jgi:hypothetical protein
VFVCVCVSVSLGSEILTNVLFKLAINKHLPTLYMGLEWDANNSSSDCIHVHGPSMCFLVLVSMYMGLVWDVFAVF